MDYVDDPAPHAPSPHADPVGERYAGLTTAPADLPTNPVLESLFRHRSIRHFLPAALPEGTIETLVAAASSAPTSSNKQAWSVVAVQDPDRIQRLAELSNKQKFIAKAPLFLCWIADLSRLDRLGEMNQRKLEGLEFLESYMVALIDAALAAQNAVVAAESMGLGTVYIGGLRSKPEPVAKELKLPPYAFAVFGLCVGHPDPNVPSSVKPRLPQSLVLHREEYATTGEAPIIAEYDAALSAFSERVGMGKTDWTQRMMSRIGTPASLGGRDTMRTTLNALGFPLR